MSIDPPDLLARRLSHDPAGPLVTWYDDADDARVELSAATLANAVAKSAGLLADGLGVQPGDTVGIALPLHWQGVVAVLAVWAAGAVPMLGSTSGTAAFVSPELAAEADADDVVAVSLAPLGGAVRGGVPAGVTDYVEAAAHADSFTPRGRVAVPEGPAAVPAGARVLSVLALDSPDGVWWGVLGALAGGGSTVLVAHPDPARLAGRCAAERVTHTAGVAVEGLPRLD